MSENKILKPVSKTFHSVSHRDSEIEVFVPVNQGDEKNYVRMTFPRKGIKIVECPGRRSTLILPDGSMVSVNLKYDVLKDKLSAGAGHIDLKDVTGKAAEMSETEFTLRKNADGHLEAVKKSPKLLIKARVKQYSVNNHVDCTFYEDEIIFPDAPEGYNHSNWTYMGLKNRTIFDGQKGFSLGMSQGEFLNLLNHAKAQGVSVLDVTKPHTPVMRSTLNP